MNSTLFFGEGVITSIDHAYVDLNGDIIGGSIAPAFNVSGEVEQQESVVIDFSRCKKAIKEIIDGKERGIDHKLIIGGFSNLLSVEELGDGQIKIVTSKWVVNCPTNAVHLIPHGQCDCYEDIEQYIGKFVEKEMQEEFPGVKVESIGSGKPVCMPWVRNPSMFRYSHGLKNSSSWGCQNIAHGHLSFICVESEDVIGGQILQQQIATELDRTMFIFKDNVVGPRAFSYTTERGAFTLTAADDHKNIILTDTESTIEFLAELIVNRFDKELHDVLAYRIYVSEGLQKGSVINL